jgi:hypothetical protein
MAAILGVTVLMPPFFGVRDDASHTVKIEKHPKLPTRSRYWRS